MSIDPQRPSAELLLAAYARGVFPMADPRSGRVDWYSPDPRATIPLTEDEGFHVPKNLAREVRRGRFEIRSNTDFERVIRACAGPREYDSGGTWISERMIAAYTALHERGHAHSVEAWLDDRLVGGLYGVHIGGGFFGESMFSRPGEGGTNASKICLVHLVRRLGEAGFTLLDTQFWNPHLAQFGCVEIPRREYLKRLAEAIERPAAWPW